MPLGKDNQYDLNWVEQDKVRRRIDLKNRLKAEGVRKRYDPYLQLEKVMFTDPAVDRYQDFRKKGRMPNAPFKPSLFFGMVAFVFVPIGLCYVLMKNESDNWKPKVESGEIPYEARTPKCQY